MANKRTGDRAYDPGSTLSEVMEEQGFDVEVDGFTNNDENARINIVLNDGIPTDAQGKDESMGYDCNVGPGAPFASNRQTGNKGKGGDAAPGNPYAR